MKLRSLVLLQSYYDTSFFIILVTKYLLKWVFDLIQDNCVNVNEMCCALIVFLDTCWKKKSWCYKENNTWPVCTHINPSVYIGESKAFGDECGQTYLRIYDC